MGRRPKSSNLPSPPLVEPSAKVKQPSTRSYEVSQHSEQQLRVIVGSNLREARRRSGLTQTEVAERIGSATSYIGIIERGDANISLGMLSRLASVVGVSPQALIHESFLGDDPSQPFNKLAAALQENISVQRASLASSVASFDALNLAIKTIFEALREPSQAASVAKKLGQR